MRLKKLVVHGFKSFADRTVLQFDEGITGIVGPNGCGKSNIADAFRWVMGEQSARSMRGEKMQDVLFAGTPRRKPLPFAEVILTFTEVQGILPVDFEEVEVGRRLYRSGESEYRLNGTVVRLKDIHSLFWDSGLGKDAFAIFEQGKMEQIILKSPEERRAIFEETAGILRFLQRRKEASRKLEETEANAVRLEDVLREVQQQVETLEKQVGEAKLFKEQKRRLEELERGILLAKWKLANEERKKLAKQLATVHEGLQKGELQERDCETRHREAKVALTQLEQVLQQRTEEFFRCKSSKEVKETEGKSSRLRLKECEQRRERLLKEREELQVRRQEAKRQFEEGQQQSVLLKRQVEEAESAWNQSREGAQELQREVGRLREEQKKAENDRLELVQKTHAVTAQLQENRVRLENSRERMAHFTIERQKTEERFEALGQSIQEKRSALRQALLFDR